MNVYVDSSVILRVIIGEPGRLSSWDRIRYGLTSELTRLECLRTIDRGRIRHVWDDATVARLRGDAIDLVGQLAIVPLDRAVLTRAADPFPTSLGSLDAIHLASADLARDQVDALRFATHDTELAIAALALGFRVEGSGPPRTRATRLGVAPSSTQHPEEEQ